MLIQGAPGVGKTALLEEMAIDAMEKRWSVFKINYDDLHNPVQMAQTLGKPYVARKQASIKADGKLLGAERIKEIAGDSSVPHVLENMNPRKGVLLVLDEAQYVGRFFNTSNESAVASTLNKLHNGELPHPTILLAAGLGVSKASFGDLGISRFRGGCFVELGALGKESEHAVIHDWLVKEGGAEGDSTPWIDAIAQKTHGWPQHISAYGDVAAKQIQYDDGEMTSSGLEVVYQLGEDRREAYYEQRAEGISGRERGSLARLIKNVAFRDGLYKEDVIEVLSQECGDPDKAKNLFNKAVERGILHSQGEVYSTPIPSMRTWMISKYARERIIPYASQLSPSPLHERNSGIESREL